MPPRRARRPRPAAGLPLRPAGRPAAAAPGTTTRGRSPRPCRREVESWRRRSATGAIMTGFAFGLREVFEPERKEPSIVMETSGVPPTDLPVEAEFDGIAARRSVVRIRPWLLERTGGTARPPATAGVRRPRRRARART